MRKRTDFIAKNAVQHHLHYLRYASTPLTGLETLKLVDASHCRALVFSVVLYTCLACLATVVFILRRRYVGGELGGKGFVKYLSAVREQRGLPCEVGRIEI